MTEQGPFAQLAARVVPGGTLRRVWSLSGGMSAQLTALEVALPNGETQKLVVRQPNPAALRHTPHAAAVEYRLLRLLAAAGIPVPSPLWLDESATLLPTPYVVTAFVAGNMDFALDQANSYAAQMATQLAAIHRVTGWEGLPLAAGCGELAARQPLNEAMGEGMIRAALARHGLAQPQNEPVLLHGDFWPGNVLWEGGKLTAVLDWEDAKQGDPLLDVAISRLDLAWIFSPKAMEVFTRRYGELTAVSPTNLPYWDLCAALRFIRLAGEDLAGWAAYYRPFHRPDITEQTIRRSYHRFVEQAIAALRKPLLRH